MRNEPTLQTSFEKRLRQGVPTLRAPDPARVDEACARIASAPPASPLRETRTFTKPLLRVAACLALLFGIALLLRPARQAAPASTLPSIPFDGLAVLMKTQDLENTLACEATNLAADLAALTADQ